MERVGDRVRLLWTDDAFKSLPKGSEGTVTYIDSMGTLHVKWDSGSRLGLIKGIDHWEVIPRPKREGHESRAGGR